MEQNNMQDGNNVAVGSDSGSDNADKMRAYLYEDYLAIYEVDLASDKYTTILDNTDEACESVCDEGYYSEYILGRMLPAYVCDKNLDALLRVGKIDNLKDILSREKRTELEFETKSAKGGFRKLTFSAVEKEANGLPVKVRMAFSELSMSSGERLRQQSEIIEAFRREQELGEVRMDFISRMSHDIRTPLNAIVGMTMIARNDLDDRETLDDCLSKIEVASDQMLNLVNGLLDIGRAEHDKERVANVPFDIAEIIESVNTVAEPLAEAKRHMLTVKTENINHEMVSGDVQRILRIINNLVSNAIKYTPVGGHISVILSEGNERDDGRFDYKIVVTDDGYGMSEDFLAKIYNPFIRGIDKRVSDESGTGLGMAITHNLVNLIGGTIDIKSEIDVGTQITVNVPLMIYRMGTVFAPAEVAQQGILVLCEKEMCEGRKCTASGRCIKAVLEEQGIPVDIAYSIDTARFMIDAKRSKNTDYYVVIINAEQYTEFVGDLAIKLRISLGASVPLMLITNRDWLSIELDARSKGVNFFLKRPVFMKNLVEILNKIHDHTADEEEVEQKKLPNCTGKRVLIVEDNDVNAQILAAILSTSGAVIDRVENGEEAFGAVRDMPSDWYDLIFMDIEMPVMNGYDATKAIRELEDKEKSRKPVVAMTANAFSADASRARDVGMSDHLTKPVQIDKLSEVLRRYLG